MHSLDRFLYWFVWAMVIMLIAGVLFLWCVSFNARKDAFMRECTKDHKRYECEIMYK